MLCTIESGDFGWDYTIEAEDGRTILVQTDFDYPGLARNLGWEPCHNATDGTIDCRTCGRTASDLIGEAQEYIDEHLSEPFEDPGYFPDEE